MRLMIFKKSFKKSLFVAAFFGVAAVLCAQDFEEPIRLFSYPAETTYESQEQPEPEPIEVEQEEIQEQISVPVEEPLWAIPVEQPEPESVPEVQPEVESETQPETEPEEPEVQPKPQPEPQPEPEPEPQPEQTAEEQPAESTEKQTYEALALIRYKNSVTVSFRLKVSYIPKPYIVAISLSAGYTDYKLLQPFYFGGFLEPHVGIPQKEFPYKYELNGEPLAGPLIIGGKLYMPFGICVFPFQENIEFFVELAPGITLNMMWNSKFGNDTITSKLYPAFYGALKTGVAYRGFTFFIEGNYDAILGFGVSAGIGYSINFNMN